MRYILSDNSKPINDVDVYVVTESGRKGIARYWNELGGWLTQDKNISAYDEIKKWKYANAKN